MFVVRECVQECGRIKVIACESLFATIEGAKSCMKRHYDELCVQQERWPGVWSRHLGDDRYTIDNNDGDFFEGHVVFEK